MIMGMGVDWSEVHQIRNEFLDINFRNNVSQLNFYSVKVQAGLSVETLLGELHGAYNFQTVLNNMWYAIQELTAHPEGIATRQFFLSNANTFLTKSQEVFEGLIEYQFNLDDQIREVVNGRDGINATVAAIGELNLRIRMAEAGGEKANDWRDERHRLLDHLATLIPIDAFYAPNGDINITSLGHHLLTGNTPSLMGLRYIANEISFVEPVFTTSRDILSAGTTPTEFTSYLNYLSPINSQNQNDRGKLLALLQARGNAPANHLSASVAPPIPADGSLQTPPVDGLLQLANVVRDAIDAMTPAPTGSFIAQLTATLNAETDPVIRAQLERALAHAERDPNRFIQRLVFLDPANPANADEIEQITREMQRDFLAQTHNHRAHIWSINHAMIPQVQMNLDRIVNSVVTMINDALTGNLRGEDGNFLFFETNDDGTPFIPDPTNIDPITGEPMRVPIRPRDLDDNFGVPLFIRDVDVTTGDRTWPITEHENPNRASTIFTTTNIRINPDFFDAGGHNLLALSLGLSGTPGGPGDTDLLVALQKVWMSGTGHYSVTIGERNFNVQDAYIRFTGNIATEIAEANSKVTTQTIQTDQAQNMRMAVKGVSMDEEMAAMLRFQFAFQAASRVFNMIDQMIDRLVNGTGRVGL
jgi:flagellar hook-associated protein FlgK